MDLVSKIVRLNKIPELLKHKQEAEEEESKQKREQRRDHQKDENREAAHFEIEDRAIITDLPIEELKVKARPAEPPRKSPVKKEGVGDRIDLTI